MNTKPVTLKLFLLEINLKFSLQDRDHGRIGQKSFSAVIDRGSWTRAHCFYLSRFDNHRKGPAQTSYMSQIERK